MVTAITELFTVLYNNFMNPLAPKDASPEAPVRPFILTYGQRGPDGAFTERVQYALEGSQSDILETPEVSALKYM